jgi:hypothetical protein
MNYISWIAGTQRFIVLIWLVFCKLITAEAKKAPQMRRLNKIHNLREGSHHNNEEDPAPGRQERLEQDIQNGGQEGPENI